MKKIISFILAAIIAALMMPYANISMAGAVVDGLIENADTETNIVNPVALVQKISGDNAFRSAEVDGEKMSGIMVDASDVDDYEEFFSFCSSSSVIPNITVSDSFQIASIISASENTGFRDMNIVSDSAGLLSSIRSKIGSARTGLKVSLSGNEISNKEGREVRTAVRGAPATFCVIDSEYASIQNVRTLQSFALAVWVSLDSTDITEVVKAAVSGANGIICTDAGLVKDTITGLFDEGTFTRTPLMIGHRGYPDIAPENSLESFRVALESGADIFEIDVDLTKDGHVVVMHDGSINRTTNYDGNLSISEMTLEEIREYNIVSSNYYPGEYKIGEVTDLKVPTLEEVLELLSHYPDRKVFIELKGSNPGTVDETSRIVKEYGMDDQVDVISFNSDLLRQILTDTNIPGMSTGLLGGESTSEVLNNTFHALLSAIDASQSCSSTINYSGVSYRPFIKAANDRGMTVWPWTYGLSTNDMAFFLGSAGITTDAVGWAADMFKYLEAENVTVGVGKKADAEARGVKYTGDKVSIAPNKVGIKILEGDAVSVNNGRIIGNHVGTAELLYSVKTKTESGSEYTLVYGPVSVEVTNDGLGRDILEPDIDIPDEEIPVREGVEIYVSHYNRYNAFSNDAMIVANTGNIETVKDVPEVPPTGVLKRNIMYVVENQGGKYIAVKYINDSEMNDYTAPDPVEGFLIFFAPTNRSYNLAKGGKLLGYEFVLKDFNLYNHFDNDTHNFPDDYLLIEAYKPENGSGFEDVETGSYYDDAVTWAVYMNVTSGTSETTFSPGDPCTRAQAVTFLWRAAGSPSHNNSENPFSDVTKDKYYYDAVLWALEQNITNGTTATTFSPGSTCTRGQIVTFLRRANGSPKAKSSNNPFTDVKNDKFYYDAVLWAVEKGITNGTSSTTFSPEKTCTRAQIVTFLFRAQ